MTRRVSLPLLVGLAVCGAACGDRKPAATPAATARASADTMPANLDSLATAIPPAAPDTAASKPVAPTVRTVRSTYPPAPEALMAAVRREQSFSQFCYEEFGQKNDPTLAGTVAMAVAVGTAGITDARVSTDRWSSGAGKGVNSCLDERAVRAWKLSAGAVKPGTYLVQLRFRPS